jgi:hypothetical protein
MFSDEFFDVVGFPSCWKTERYNFSAPPPRVGDGLHVVVSAHYGNSPPPPRFVHCMQGRLFSNHVLYSSYPDVFNDVTWVDSKLSNVTVGKGGWKRL